MQNRPNPDEVLLDEEFDEESVDIARKGECCPDDDPADAFDIFPDYLTAESKFYPKSWR